MTHIDHPPASGLPMDHDHEEMVEEQASLRRVVVGSVLGFLGVYALIVFMCWLLGISLGAAAGVGLFVAIFGGAGFGAMMGGAYKADHHGE